MNKNIIGRQYGYRSSALRAIRNYQKKYGCKLSLWVNQIDCGCYEIDGGY